MFLLLLSFSSSHLDLPKGQIRVVLFRECDRRGRKLLYDSHSVEKLSLGTSFQSAGYLCRQKCDQGVKISDFVEIAGPYAYRVSTRKYKYVYHVIRRKFKKFLLIM